MRTRLLSRLVIMLGVSLLGVVHDTHATPLSVAYVDTATGLEWAQVADATGYHHYQLATVCATDGSAACSSSLPGVELAGWTWATSHQVMDLLVDAAGLPSEQLNHYFVDPPYGTVYVPGSVSEIDSTFAPLLLSLFAPTIVTDTYRAVRGWVADGVYHDFHTAWLPEVIDAAGGGLDTAGRGPLSDSHEPMVGGTLANPGSPERGTWLFRPAQSVPEPSTLVLLSVGALGAIGAQRRRR
jgi:hypothetical protein